MTLIDEHGSGPSLRRDVMDLATVFSSVVICALLVRSMSGLPQSFTEILLIATTISMAQVIFLSVVKGYRSAWRFFSAPDVIYCLAAAVVSTSIGAFVWSTALPLAGWIIVAGGCALASTAIRCTARLIYSYGWFRETASLTNPIGRVRSTGEKNAKRVALVIGYGENLEMFLRTQRKRDADFEIVGIVTIAHQKHAATLRGIPILGSIDQMDAIAHKLSSRNKEPDLLILTRDEMEGRSVANILSKIDTIKADIAWMPRINQLDTGDSAKLHPIKFEDLLPRPAQSFDSHACETLLSKATVLVTGAGGSIGSELVRQIATLSPGEIILTDSSEHALYEIGRETGVAFPNIAQSSMILDVRDRDAVFRLMERHKPDFVFHAAALKHVPVVEKQPCEGVLTNVVGSQNVADAAIEVKARAMVMVSTDKAVNPANVMGATKRLAEAYCQARDADRCERGGDTRFVTVRFGNVLGSNGSVVPLFQRQLAQGDSLTVTHPDIERFFMTIPEASRLILEAMLVGMEDNEVNQGIFVLDMGKPVKIIDLARQIIRLSGLRPDIDVKIVYTGLRPGEKLYEELMHETENLLPTGHPSVMVAQPRFVQLKAVQNQISVIAAAAKQGNEEEVVRLLKVYIPEFETTSDEAKRVRDDMTNIVVLRETAS